jgi:hypothetical protein
MAPYRARAAAPRARREVSEADQLLEECRLAWEALHCPWGVAMTLLAEAGSACIQGDISRMRQSIARSLRIRRAVGDLRGAAECLELAAYLHDSGGTPARAARSRAAALRLRDVTHSRAPSVPA